MVSGRRPYDSTIRQAAGAVPRSKWGTKPSEAECAAERCQAELSGRCQVAGTEADTGFWLRSRGVGRLGSRHAQEGRRIEEARRKEAGSRATAKRLDRAT